MKLNQFVRVTSKADAIAKTAFKKKNIGVLYCLFDSSVYVVQKMKIIEITLEMFAEGMDLDLIEAQAIIHGEHNSIEEVRQSIDESKRDFDQELENEEQVESGNVAVTDIRLISATEFKVETLAEKVVLLEERIKELKELLIIKGIIEETEEVDEVIEEEVIFEDEIENEMREEEKNYDSDEYQG